MQQIILDSLFKYYEWCGNFKNIVKEMAKELNVELR